MKNKRHLDSTEELLEVIRGDQPVADSPDSAPDEGAVSKPVRRGRRDAEEGIQGDAVSKARLKARRKSIFSGLSLRRNGAVAVEIREDSVVASYLAKQGKNPVCSRMALPEAFDENSPELFEAITSVVQSVTGGKKADVWGVLRSSDIDISTITVPKVPDRQLAKTVFWRLKKERQFDPDDYDLDFRLLGSVKEDKTSKLQVLTAMARKVDVDKLASVLRTAGYTVAGITSVATAIYNAYSVGELDSEDRVVASVHIDSAFSCINIIKDKKLLFSRTIKTGTFSMSESLLLGIGAGSFRDWNANKLRTMMMDSLIRQEEVACIDGVCIKPDRVFELVSPALERLARQVERTIGFFYSNQQIRCDEIHFSGVLFGSQEVRKFMGNQMGLPHGFVDLFSDDSGAEGYNTTIGGALSAFTKSINFVFNYKARAVQRFWNRVMDATSLLALVLCAVLSGLFLWQKSVVLDTSQDLTDLKQKYAQLEPKVEENELNLMLASFKKQQKELKTIVKDYAPVAVMAELASIVPEGMKLLDVTIDYSGTAPMPKNDGAEAQPAKPASHIVDGVVVVEAIISGPGSYEAIFSKFLINLEASPLFNAPVVHSSRERVFTPEGDVYHVTLHAVLL